MCTSCGRQASVTAGTIFHRTRTPLTTCGSKEPAHVNLPGVHMIASLLKRWLTGTLHYTVSQEHLAYYLDRYTFRFNRRASKSRGLLFYRLLQQVVDTEPHPLAQLRNPVAAAEIPF